MGQTPSVNPDESKVTDLELSMPEITSGNSQGVPVDPSVFRAAKTRFKIKKLHAIIGFVAIGIVLLAIIIGILFSEISSLKDKAKKQEENLKEKENENKAAIAELKAKDMKSNANIAALEAEWKARDNANKATIALLKNQTKTTDNQIMNIVNKVKHVEIGKDAFCGDRLDLQKYWDCAYGLCTLGKTIPFSQSYDTPPLVALMLNSKADNVVENYWSLRVTRVEKNKFSVVCGKNGDNKDQKLWFSWISIPNI